MYMTIHCSRKRATLSSCHSVSSTDMINNFSFQPLTVISYCLLQCLVSLSGWGDTDTMMRVALEQWAQGSLCFFQAEANQLFAETTAHCIKSCLAQQIVELGLQQSVGNAFPFSLLGGGRWPFTWLGQHYSLWTRSPLHRHRPGRELWTELDGRQTSNNIFDLFPELLHSSPAPLY